MTTEAPQKKPQPTRDASAPQCVPVRVLWFDQSIELPGKMGGTSLTHDPKATMGKRWDIELVPWLRSFRIVYFEPEKPPVVRYVHESHVSQWEPLES